MNKLTLTIGLPASGKSTWAKEEVRKSKGRTKRLNKDDLRMMIDNGVYSKSNEKLVVATERQLCRTFLGNGLNVIIDNTNFAMTHQEFYKNLAKELGAQFEINNSFLATPLDVCIERDLKRLSSVGEKVIRKMYNEYVKLPTPIIEYNEKLPYVVICDIDGTLAHMVNRSPFDWHKVGKDDVDSSVAFVTDALVETKRTKLIIFSGRDSVCRPETEDWLDRNDIEYDALYMRAKNDNRKDTEIKRELYEKYIQGKYNVLAVIDDRPCVCDMWRDLGLKVMQVGDPHVEF